MAGPTPIAAGLVVLIAAAWWPMMPATTGVALVALGATGVLVNQVRLSTMLSLAVAAHLVVYVTLYLLFVGAISHAAMTGPQDGLRFLQGVDFGVSAGLMTLALRVGLAAVIGGGDTPAR